MDHVRSGAGGHSGPVSCCESLTVEIACKEFGGHEMFFGADLTGGYSEHSSVVLLPHKRKAGFGPGAFLALSGFPGSSSVLLRCKVESEQLKAVFYLLFFYPLLALSC